jgi:phospholipid/cholesterol/gamma-HCH transport system substrate-binding protein
MSEPRHEYKVGLFVIIGIGLIALLILNFSKGVTLGMSTYKLRVILPNAAGLKTSADVMMAGVSIGKVTQMSLADDARSVDITVVILSKFKIRTNAAFRIDALGFLGDQYVDVSVPPQGSETNQVAYLQDGATVEGVPSLNMVQAVQSISGVLDQAKKAIRDLDLAITNINASALSRETLAHFVAAVSNLEVVSARAVGAADRAEGLLRTNEAPFNAAVKNFNVLSESLTNSAGRLDGIIADNKEDVRTVVTNLVAASERVKQISAELENGKGPAGALLKDEQLRAQLESTVSNANTLTAELTLFGHNLNQRGIWAMLWRPKIKEHETPSSQPAKKR